MATIVTEADPMAACGMDPRSLERITRWQEALVAGGQLPMALSVVSRRGKVAYARATGYADAAQQTLLRDDDIFRLYSMTKPPVAVGLLMLYDEGRFQLDDPARVSVHTCAHCPGWLESPPHSVCRQRVECTDAEMTP
jgi:CubicO group peptidase (beta-lactamase class C family)